MTMNTITGIVAVLIGLAYSYLAWNLPRATVGSPIGPIVFPLLLGGGMVLMGGIQLVQELGKMKVEDKKVSLSFTNYGKSIAWVTALCVLYVFLFERLGYLISTFLFLVTVLFLFNGKGKWKSVLALAAGFSVGVYVLFGSVLNIQLPRMPVLGL